MYISLEALNYNCFKIRIIDKTGSWQKDISEYIGWNLLWFGNVA